MSSERAHRRSPEFGNSEEHSRYSVTVTLRLRSPTTTVQSLDRNTITTLVIDDTGLDLGR